METVNVYTMQKNEYAVYPRQAFVEIVNVEDYHNWTPVENGYIRTERLPVQEYRWSNGKRILAAMPTELRDIIGIEVDEIESLKTQLYNSNKDLDKCRAENINLKQDRDKFLYMSLWERVKFLFIGYKEYMGWK